MNKVFEIIEAKNIFNVNINNLKILIHKNSYLHAIIRFKDGLTKMIIHETDMQVPIFNTLFENKAYFKKHDDINIDKINNLNLEKPDNKKFSMLKILKIPKKISLFETVVFLQMIFLFIFKKKNIFYFFFNIFFSIVNDKSFKKYKEIKPKSVRQILDLKNLVQIKIKSRYK